MSQFDKKDRLGSHFEFGDHLSATTTRKGKIIGFSESEGRGRAASGDANDSGSVEINIAGKPPRGEEGTLQSCQRLIGHLNSTGQSWSTPSEVSGVQYIDAVASGEESFSGKTLKIQVVRALTDPRFWQSLGHNENATISLSLVESAEILKVAVQFKAEKIPLEYRSQLTLALDASDLPGLALDPVIDEFNLRYSDWVESQGFQSVWIIGPWREMVNQLGRTKA